MRIWQIEEQCDYPGMALAVASVWTPVDWGQAKAKAWICQGDEALRGLFPNLPEVFEGPWGSLPRSQAMGPGEACSAILDAIEGLTLSEGGAIDKAFETGTFTFGAESISERAESGRLDLEGFSEGQLSMTSAACWINVQANRALYKGNRAAALGKIDAALDSVGSRLREWMPCMVELADPGRISKEELDYAAALARRAQIGRASRPASGASGPKGGL